MSKVFAALVAVVIVAGLEVAADKPIIGFYDWAVVRRDQIGAGERARQEDIQTVEIEGAVGTPFAALADIVRCQIADHLINQWFNQTNRTRRDNGIYH